MQKSLSERFPCFADFEKEIRTNSNVKALAKRRLNSSLVQLIGQTVVVKSKDGAFEGVFHDSKIAQGNLGVELACSKRVGQDETKRKLNDIQRLPSFSALVAKDIVIAQGTSFVSVSGDSKFTLTQVVKTDSDISGNAPLKERELKPWKPEATSPVIGLEEKSRGNDYVGDDGKWDQFKANEVKFGVRTDYEEEIYTTRIDRNSEAYKKRDVEAARIAKEIESSGTSNFHVAEERGLEMNISLDEEDRYGAVLREPNRLNSPLMNKRLSQIDTQNIPKAAKDAPMSANVIGREVKSKFDQFAKIEKKRIEATKQIKMLHAIEIDELKKFGKNFKLDSEMPAEIVELTRKDKPVNKENDSKKSPTDATFPSKASSESKKSVTFKFNATAQAFVPKIEKNSFYGKQPIDLGPIRPEEIVNWFKLEAEDLKSHGWASSSRSLEELAPYLEGVASPNFYPSQGDRYGGPQVGRPPFRHK